MSFSSRLNEWLSIILKFVIIGVAVLGGIWLAISMSANFLENNNAGSLPDFPDINKAQYTVYFKATGNVILTGKYDHPADNLYILHGYWEVRDGKYKFTDGDLSLDEVYFGDIIITRRAQ